MFFTIMGKEIPAYGAMICLGLATGTGMGNYLIRKNKMSVDEFILCAAYAVLGGFVGAKLLYLWVSRDHIQWYRILEYDYFRQIMSGGFVFYGGLVGGLLGLWMAARLHHISSWNYLCTGIPVLPLVHGFGRIGCGLVGCCYGIPYEGVCSVIYQRSVAAPVQISLFPVQYLEAVVDFVISGLLFFYVKNSDGKKWSVPLYLMLYSSARFGIEFLRYDNVERGSWNLFSTSQWISIGIFFSTLVYLIVRGGRER